MPDYYTGYGNFPGWVGFALMCVSIILIAIPVVVGILTLRKKKPAADIGAVPPMPPQGPLPPAS